MIQRTENAIAARTAAHSVRTPQKAAVTQQNSFAAALESSVQPAAAPKAAAQANPTASNPLPPLPPGIPAMFGPEAVEQRMNDWLVGVITRQNEVKMMVYNQAVENHKAICARNQVLGLALPPPPPPPQLEAAEPMPSGWWFQIHS